MTRHQRLSLHVLLLFLSFTSLSLGQGKTKLSLLKTIKGGLAPKSIITNGKGKFFAQNMMYLHTVTVYDAKGNLLKTISDEVTIKNAADSTSKILKGSPVEACATADGKYVWVSNYQMYGEGYDKPGCDACIGSGYDKSILYKINTETYKIEAVVEVGSVPKFIALSPDERFLAVSNWTSATVSIINPNTHKHIRTIKVGAYPRGLAFNDSSTKLYVTSMGRDRIEEIDLSSWSVKQHKNIGDSPRHIIYHDTILYVSLNKENKILKWNLTTNEKQKLNVGSKPRSTALTKDGKYLYVVNYGSNTMSKINTTTMKVEQTEKTGEKPIGITIDEVNKHIWVSCYQGVINIFQEVATITEGINALPKQMTLSNTGGKYHIIVASLTSKSDAEKLKLKLVKRGHSPTVLSSDKRYRLSVASFNTAAEAHTNIKKYTHINEGVWVLEN